LTSEKIFLIPWPIEYIWGTLSGEYTTSGVLTVVSLNSPIALATQKMTSKRPPKSRQPQQDPSGVQPTKPKRRKGKTIEIRYKYGDNDMWFRMSPKFLAAVATTLTTLLGLSTVNLVLQARHQNPALPASQRIVENPGD
jgi:hypothetical protein